jgi:ankyrin repeat protein
MQPQNMQSRPVLVEAAHEGYIDIVGLLLRYGARSAAVYHVLKTSRSRELHGLTALHLAARNGHEDIVLLLLRHGADINSITDDGCTPLSMAVRAGKVEVIKRLLTKGAPVNSPNGTKSLLHISARYENGAVVKLLLDYGGNHAVVSISRSLITVRM